MVLSAKLYDASFGNARGVAPTPPALAKVAKRRLRARVKIWGRKVSGYKFVPQSEVPGDALASRLKSAKINSLTSEKQFSFIVISSHSVPLGVYLCQASRLWLAAESSGANPDLSECRRVMAGNGR